MTAPELPPPPAPVPVISPAAGSKLEQLAAEYAIAHPAAAAAKKRLDDIVTAIKVELTNAAPGQRTVDFTSDELPKPLRLNAVTSWQLDTKKLKADDPALYVRYARQSTKWELRQVSG